MKRRVADVLWFFGMPALAGTVLGLMLTTLTCATSRAVVAVHLDPVAQLHYDLDVMRREGR